MGKRIVVNVGVTETRLAVQDGTSLTELHVERARRRSIVGNIYKGVVTNVLPGMQAAFVDVGLGKDAFLYAGDYTENRGEEEGAPAGDNGGEPGSEPDDEPDVDVAEDAAEARAPAAPGTPIEQLLARGKEILVQVSKESLGSKGARITSFISLPGRYIVFMPQARHVGVSRRITDQAERERLRDIVKELKPGSGGGFIVRTVAQGLGAAELGADIEFLSRLWSQIQSRVEAARAPALLHEEGDLLFRAIRDLFSADVEELLVDSRAGYDKAQQLATTLVPALAGRVRWYSERTPIFETTGIEREIERALRRRVWLKSGGYIVIDHTEALVSIDVNTGKYVGKRDFEETVLKINLEAAAEAMRQIRLRDLGGLIVVDFIDMERADHREQVSRAVQRALAEDKARTNVLPISELGLVEMTRKRARQDLEAVFHAACPTCRGSGKIKSDATLAAEIFRKVQATAGGPEGQEVVVRVHPELAHHLETVERDALGRLETLVAAPVAVQAAAGLSREEYEVAWRVKGGE